MSFNTTWVPFYYEYKKNNSTELILLRTKNYTIVFSIITMSFILLSPEVYKLMSPKEYWTGIKLVPLIAVSYYFIFLYSFPVSFEFYNEKTKQIAIGTICAAIINILCNFLFIPIYAEMGAAIATLISFILLFIFHEISSRFMIKNYENKFSIYGMGIIPISITVLLFYIIHELWYIRWGIGIILGSFFLQRIIKNKAIF
jgi:O-antigen/teichoic acid export membrane protein